MIRAAVILMLLSLAVPVRMEDEFDARSVPPKMEVPRLFLPNSKRFLQQANASEAAAMRDASQHLKEETALLFQALEACRETFRRMSNQTFKTQSYGVKSEAFKSALRHCNISEELVGKLKAELSQLKTFQDVSVLIPRNNSSESPDQGKPTQQPSPPASKKNIRTTAVESKLNLNIGEEWLQVAPKVAYMSHIYLGSSIYPIMTEESRVLDEEVTPPGSSQTEASVAREILAPSGWVPSLPWRHPYRLISTLRQQENISTALRQPRSLRNSTPKGSAKGTNPSDAPHKLSLLPRDPQHRNKHDKRTECRMDLKKLDENHHYRMLHKLCSAILRKFRQFLKEEMLKRKTEKLRSRCCGVVDMEKV